MKWTKHCFITALNFCFFAKWLWINFVELETLESFGEAIDEKNVLIGVHNLGIVLWAIATHCMRNAWKMLNALNDTIGVRFEQSDTQNFPTIVLKLTVKAYLHQIYSNVLPASTHIYNLVFTSHRTFAIVSGGCQCLS